MTEITAQTVIERIGAITARIHQAMDTARQNQPVDVQDLERDVEAVCLLVREPGPRDDATVRTALSGLLADLDALESELTRRRDTLMGGQADTIAPNAAASAYGKTKT